MGSWQFLTPTTFLCIAQKVYQAFRAFPPFISMLQYVHLFAIIVSGEAEGLRAGSTWICVPTIFETAESLPEIHPHIGARRL